LLLASSAFCISNAQITRVENAKYFDNDHNLYNGVYKETFDNGKPKLEMYLVNGEQDSTTTIYFEDGTINEIRSYKHGLMHGKWETFNSKGSKIAEAWYRNDKKDGIWRIWDENGSLRYEMPYSNGQKTGSWKIFDEKGELVTEKTYE
jgi:antitoxin component YwqK of YwqJK toxin-antitoxin module